MSTQQTRILTILILAAALRFVQIDAPPVGRHAWRQCDTASVARNYHRLEGRFLYPQIDWEIPGYVDMELPIYPWTVAALYGLTGESHALARSLAVLGSLIAIGLLYLLVRRILGESIALWAALFAAVLPLGTFLSRAIMPESWMLAATIAAVYCFWRWTEEERWLFFILAGLTTALACLLKLTSLYLGLPFLWLIWRRWGRRGLTRWQTWLFAVLVVVPLVAWYWHAFRLGQEYGASFHILTAAGSDKWGNWELLTEPLFYRRVFLDYLGGRILTWAGLGVFLVGLFLPRSDPREHLFDIWLLAVVAVLLLASGGSYQHDYYSIPMLLPAVVFMGKATALGWERRRALTAWLLLIILALSAYRYLGQLAEERRPGTDQTIAEVLASRTRKSDLVISCNSANPVWLYLADRRGFGRNCDLLTKVELEELIERGARFLVDRPDPRSESGSHPTRSHTAIFYNVLQNDDGIFLADVGQRRAYNDFDWRGLHWVGLDTDKLGSHLDIPFGRSQDHTVDEIRPTEPFPPGEICRIQAALSIPEVDSAPRARKVRVRAWWNHRNQSGISVTLHPRRNTIRVRQYLNGESLRSVQRDSFFDPDRLHLLEIRFDLYEFEVWLNRELVLTLENRQSPLPAGGFQIQAWRGRLEIRDLVAQCAKPVDGA